MDVGLKLKQILKKEKISAYKLGQELKIDQGYLSKIINGKTQPTFVWMERVLKYLGYSIDFKKKGGKKK
jgi:transcriptional regulator with XRE-family HTH domain